MFRYELEPRHDFAFIDMKSFYASCECIDRGLDPLKALLVVMSNTDNSKGLILASSPMAKKVFGIKNVSRSWDLPRHHPFLKDLHIVPPRMNYYIEMNMKIQSVIRQFAPDEDILWYSIDEGVVDLTGSLNYFVAGNQSKAEKLDQVSRMIQREIYFTTGIYSTVGMSNSNPLLAKLALDNEAKLTKNMRALWNYEHVEEKVWGIQNMTDFWGIGERTKQNLERLGIYSIRDLANASHELLYQKMGVIGLQLFHHANGIDRTDIHDVLEQKQTSLGNSQVLPKDYIFQTEIEVVIREMGEQVASRIRKKNLQTKLVHLYIGYSRDQASRGFSRQRTIEGTNETKTLQTHLIHLFREFYDGSSVRNIGVTFGKLEEKKFLQLDLFQEPKEQMKLSQIDTVVDEIRRIYGFPVIVRASSLLDGARSIARSKLVGGHNGGAGGLDGLGSEKK
ncbi:MAG: Y-family DNA polymerase [Streptococcaceae bacterium]|jgi:DNA polymerase V|nr:Y-family DNA polymerase [Streptococcaceae bacterium]